MPKKPHDAREAVQEAQRLALLPEADQRAVIAMYRRLATNPLATPASEVESGKRDDRPELAKALSHAKRSKATLCVGKLDRLGRNVAFLARVMDSGCEFAAADMPAANRFMLHVMAAVAEHEAKAISDRTKAALAAYKARGGKLGAELPQCRNLTPAATAKGRERAAVARAEAASDAYGDIVPMMLNLRKQGKSLRDIAGALNEQGHTTRRGRPWNQVQVSRVLDRHE